MTSSARHRSPRKTPFPYSWLFLLSASGLWTFVFWRQAPAAFSLCDALEAWVKGLIFLGLAAAAYFSLSRGLWPKTVSTLSLFPLAWLALSRAQWYLCAEAPLRDWLSILLFMGLVFWMGLKSDGKILLSGLILGWVGLVLVCPQAIFLGLVFLFARPGLFKNVDWVRWGGAGVFIFLLVATRAWSQFQWNGLDFYEWFVEKKYLVFGILIFLGWAAFPRKGTHRSALASVGLLSLGYLVLNPFFLGQAAGMEAISWIWVWAAGFGFESLRRDLLDPSWHGRAAWTALGLGVFWGVF
jgi:hypothetical protein